MLKTIKQLCKTMKKLPTFRSLEVHPSIQLCSYEGNGWPACTHEVSGCISEQLFSKQKISFFYRKMWDFQCLDIGAFGGILRLHEAPECPISVERCRHTHQNVPQRSKLSIDIK